MHDYYLARTSHSPEVNFQFSRHHLSMTGEAYPENANDFFLPILSQLNHYLSHTDHQHIIFDFRLTYFNSAATKMLYTLFGMLNDSASSKNRITLNWFHDPEDDTILEFGEGVQDDFLSLDFHAIAEDLAAA